MLGFAMRSCQSFWLIILLGCYFLTEVFAVPPDYCLTEINTSDCGRPPTPVFYYNKLSSQCEIATWRGCPTYNVFPDRYECSVTCIFNIYYLLRQNKPRRTRIPQEPSNPKEQKPGVCDVLSSVQVTEKCTDEKEQLFTHIGNGTCTEFTWRGCPHPNLYNEKIACQMTCDPMWTDGIKDSNTTELKLVEDILDKAFDPEAEFLLESCMEDPENYFAYVEGCLPVIRYKP